MSDKYMDDAMFNTGVTLCYLTPVAALVVLLGAPLWAAVVAPIALLAVGLLLIWLGGWARKS